MLAGVVKLYTNLTRTNLQKMSAKTLQIKGSTGCDRTAGVGQRIRSEEQLATAQFDITHAVNVCDQKHLFSRTITFVPQWHHGHSHWSEKYSYSIQLVGGSYTAI